MSSFDHDHTRNERYLGKLPLYPMTCFDWDWEHGQKLPICTKNDHDLEELPLYTDLWDYLESYERNYMRQFRNWEPYVLFIVDTFPNISIDDIRKDLDDLLSSLHQLRTYDNMGICTYDSTNDELNDFLVKLSKV
jgi:hypothetical protein